MEYKIAWSEKKTTAAGKEKLEATLEDVQGVQTEKVTIWADFPNFSGLMTGHKVIGDLVPAKDPKWGPTLYSAKTFNAVANASRPNGMGAKMMEKKAENIKEAQERKEEGIAYFNSMNVAIEYLKAQGFPFTIEEVIAKQRQVLKAYEDYKSSPF
jgi:hypothetical protein